MNTQGLSRLTEQVGQLWDTRDSHGVADLSKPKAAKRSPLYRVVPSGRIVSRILAGKVVNVPPGQSGSGLIGGFEEGEDLVSRILRSPDIVVHQKGHVGAV